MNRRIARELTGRVIFEAVEKADVKYLTDFPCPTNGNMVILDDCFDCYKSNYCDIYATMLDEDFT